MLLIRPALIADAAAIAKVHVAAWQSAYAGLFPDEFLRGLSIEQREAQWIWNLNGTISTTAVAVQDGNVAGFVSFGAARDDDCDPSFVAEIMAVYVAPDAWGIGIGSRLFDFAMKSLAEQSFETVTIWVLEDNARAREFYERRGFVLDGRVSRNTHGPPLKVVRYRRPV